MPAVPYIYSGPWWSAANLNRLNTEFDRRLTLALAGKTPYLLVGYGGTTGYIPANLPVAYAGPNVRGIGPPTGIISGPAFGPCYVFKGADAPIRYFEFTDAWNQAALDTWANGLTEVSHDLTTHTVKVDISTAAPPFNLEESLRVNSRDIGGAAYRLWATPQNPDRALRRHQYAVAELACEGLAVLAVPAIWDRYECFRVHNLSGIEMTVSVEMPDTTATFTVPKFGCRSFRRRDGYFNADLNYGWLARAGRDKRFHVPGGDGWPELSACASNIARPEGLFDWLRGLQAERDPTVAMPSITSELFGNPNSDTTLVGDLIAHKGPMHSLGWVLTAPPYEIQEGAFTGHANIVADFLAMGITATVVGNLVTLARGGTAPGEPGSGLDLVAKGTNLLWCPDQTVTGPGDPTSPGFVPQRVRQYTPLPITLIETFPITIEGRYLNEIETETRTYVENGRWEAVTSPTVASETGGYDPVNTILGRMDTVADQNDVIAGPAANAQTPWSLTPEGFKTVSSFVHTIQWSYTHSSAANPTNMWEGGLYSDVSGAEITHRAFIGHDFPGWSTRDQPYAFAPRPRKLGHLAYTGANWESGDWDGEQATDEGGEPVATGKIIENRPDLVWLRNPGQPTAVPDHDRAGRYFLYYQPDEGRDGVDAPRADYRVRYAQGNHSVPGVFWRRPMQPEDWNHMAWFVNAWTRARPLMDISLVYLGGYGSGAPTHVFSNITESGGGGPWTGIRPADAYNLLPETDVAAWTAFGLTVNDSRDAQGWSTAKAALLAMKDWSYNRVSSVGAVVFHPEFYRVPAAPGTENVGEYYAWNRLGTVDGPVLVGDSVSVSVNYDYDVYSPTGDDASFWYVPISEIANLADSLGMPCTWISQGVAWQLNVFPEGPPTWANSGVYTEPTFSDVWQYNVTTGAPGIPPPALPSTTPELEPHVFALSFEQIRFSPAPIPAEIGWLANVGPPNRWGNWGVIWKTLGRQLYGEFKTPGQNSTWNPWGNLDTADYTLGGFVGQPGVPAAPTGPTNWILDYGQTDEFRDRDAQIEQKAGVWVHGSGYTGLHFPRVIKGSSWWVNYDEEEIWRPGDGSIPTGTTFLTPGGFSNSEELDAGPNLITAAEGQCFGVLVTGEIYVDLA